MSRSPTIKSGVKNEGEDEGEADDDMPCIPPPVSNEGFYMEVRVRVEARVACSRVFPRR